MHSDLKNIKDLLFFICGIKISQVIATNESKEYCAHTFKINNQNVNFRIAKITPTKIGQFVTLWKRNKLGNTSPYSIYDNFDFYIIEVKKESKYGVFIFTKPTLYKNGILSDDNKEGKRGFRVYSTWDVTANKQAKKTQLWQKDCFLELTEEKQIDVIKAKKLLGITIGCASK